MAQPQLSTDEIQRVSYVISLLLCLFSSELFKCLMLPLIMIYFADVGGELRVHKSDIRSTKSWEASTDARVSLRF
jgi:hypothetical protein